MAKLQAALPELPAMTVADVRLAAERLFRDFRAGAS